MQEKTGIRGSSLLIGVFLLIIGGFIISCPEENVFAVNWLLGILFVINGFIESFVRRIMTQATHKGCYLLIVVGIVNIIFDMLILFNVVTSTTFIVYLFAIWFIINAVLNLFTITPAEGSNKRFHMVSILLNIIEIILGVILLFNPLIAAVIIAVFMSAVFFIIGITYLIDALR